MQVVSSRGINKRWWTMGAIGVALTLSVVGAWAADENSKVRGICTKCGASWDRPMTDREAQEIAESAAEEVAVR